MKLLGGIIPESDWPCNCVKRDKNGKVTAILFHSGAVKQCKVCKRKRPVWRKVK